jgi:predicted enzyme related to lactoylglutathione lyase
MARWREIATAQRSPRGPARKLAEVTAAGATVKEPAHDVGGGRLVATVTDPDGNVLGLLQDR